MEIGIERVLLRAAAAVTAVAAMAIAIEGSAGPRLQTGPEAEITYDGLHRVDKTAMDAAWVKPDFDFRSYTKLMVVEAGISFRPIDDKGRRWRPGQSSDSEFPISDENKLRLQEEVHKAFIEELSKLERYELVDEPGHDVVALVGGLIDIVSRTPPVDACPGRCEVYLQEVGEATLVLELRDSVTNEILARAADRRAAASQGWPTNVNSVTVWSEVRQLARSWARLVVKRLTAFDSVEDLDG